MVWGKTPGIPPGWATRAGWGGLRCKAKESSLGQIMKDLLGYAKDHGIQSHHFMGLLMGKQWKQCQTLFFGAPKSLQMVTAAMKLKDAHFLEEKL